MNNSAYVIASLRLSNISLQVPKPLRVGPWSRLGMSYLFIVVYSVCMGLAWWRTQPMQSVDLEYDAVGSPLWYYNVVGFMWTTYISIAVFLGPVGLKAWATFTMWSWTFLNLRYGLSVLAPLTSKGALLLSFLEYSRFPTLILATVTFIMFNFVIAPFIYFFGMKTAKKKANFVKFMTSFRLMQLHVFNVFLAIGNCVIASPSRKLNVGDFFMSLLVVLVYLLFYLLVLDRIGVHLYPVLSPRTPWLILPLTFLICSFIGGFHFWNEILTRGEWRERFV